MKASRIYFFGFIYFYTTVSTYNNTITHSEKLPRFQYSYGIVRFLFYIFNIYRNIKTKIYNIITMIGSVLINASFRLLSL